MSHLLVISHTIHYLDSKGKPCGWTSTVKELDFLAGHFEKITHLAVLNKSATPPKSASPYSSENIQFIHISPFGGPGILNKLKILFVVPILLIKTMFALSKADVFQVRTPTSIGMFLIPFLSLFFWKEGWYKYAGNWVQPNMPKSYRLQKWMLNTQKRPVTINGNWVNQPNHVFSFENPSLDKKKLHTYFNQIKTKSYSLPLEGVFVGRLEKSKGVLRILQTLKLEGIEERISKFHFVGDGEEKDVLERGLMNSPIEVVFHGFLKKEEVFKVYKESQIVFLPSDSEGFPKVISEAAAFGCVPFVSDVSSIGQYINENNGYLWDPLSSDFSNFFMTSVINEELLIMKKNNLLKLPQKFTFEHYLNHLLKTQIIRS